MLRQLFVVVPCAILAVGGSTACATKKFVRTSVGEVNGKVDSLGHSLEETQQRTKQNEGRIAEVGQKADAADRTAEAADRAAQAAGQSAQAAHQVATGAMSMAEGVDGKVVAFDKANRRLVYEVVLNEDSGHFKFGRTELPAEAKQMIDEMVLRLKQDPKNIYIEIEGHTDNVGPKSINEKIGLERAEAAERYLYQQYQIPLHKMSTISYAGDKPVAPNKTKAGRAQNRRVVIRVLA